jgi:hypothetical protein
MSVESSLFCFMKFHEYLRLIKMKIRTAAITRTTATVMPAIIPTDPPPVFTSGVTSRVDPVDDEDDVVLFRYNEC